MRVELDLLSTHRRLLFLRPGPLGRQWVCPASGAGRLPMTSPRARSPVHRAGRRMHVVAETGRCRSFVPCGPVWVLSQRPCWRWCRGQPARRLRGSGSATQLARRIWPVFMAELHQDDDEFLTSVLRSFCPIVTEATWSAANSGEDRPRSPPPSPFPGRPKFPLAASPSSLPLHTRGKRRQP